MFTCVSRLKARATFSASKTTVCGSCPLCSGHLSFIFHASGRTAATARLMAFLPGRLEYDAPVLSFFGTAVWYDSNWYE